MLPVETGVPLSNSLGDVLRKLLFAGPDGVWSKWVSYPDKPIVRDRPIEKDKPIARDERHKTLERDRPIVRR